jgi:hypothetical protein
MAPQIKCKECENYEKQHHNYCRMCGYHLRKGYVPFARMAVTYTTSEKFCGHCGDEREKCACRG